MEEREGIMQAVAEGLDGFFKEKFEKKMGFFVVVFDFDDDDKEYRYASYCSNIQREDAPKALREAARKLEEREDIPKTIGTA